MKSWRGCGKEAVALRRDIANPADRHATEKNSKSIRSIG